MFLNIFRHNLKHLSITPKDNVTIEGCCNFIEFGKVERSQYYRGPSPQDSFGIFLGKADALNKSILQNSINTLDNYTTTIFSVNSKYPRYKLKQLSNLKRTNSIDKSDFIIIPNVDYRVSDLRSSYRNLNATSVYYSKSEDCYYVFNFILDPWYNFSKKLWELFQKASNKEDQDLDCMFNALVNTGKLPKDLELIYVGDIVYIGKEYLELDHILYNGKKCIEEQALDSILSNQQQKLTEEELVSIEQMLKSQDQSVVSVGLKLLTATDVRYNAIRIGKMLKRNWYNIWDNKASKSVGFLSTLQALSLTPNIIKNRSVDDIINATYKICTNDEDKRVCREEIIKEVHRRITNDVCRQLHVFNNLNITCNFELE